MTITKDKNTPSTFKHQPIRYELEVVKYLESKYKFLCRKNTRDLYVWDDGVFVNYEVSIEDIIVNVIETKFLEVGFSSGTIRNIIRILKAHHPQRWDESTEGINIKGGHIFKHLGKWVYESHTIDHDKFDDWIPPTYFTQLPFDYDDDAECLVFDQMITDLVGFENTSLIYKMLAYFFMPHVKFQKSFLLYGPSGTGKTTFIDTLSKLLSDALIGQERLHNLSSRWSLGFIKDCWVNIWDDLDEHSVRRTDIFRMIVTNNNLSCELKRIRFKFSFKNRIKLLFTCNKLPILPKNIGDEFFRRWVIVPCYDEVKDKDPFLLDKIDNKELSGIFNKILYYYDVLLEEGFGAKWDNIEEIRDLWMMDINPVSSFVKSKCVIDPKEQVDYNLFFKEMNKYRVDNKAKPISKTMCTKELGLLGISKSSNRKYYKGIKLCTDNTNKLNLDLY